MITIKLHHQIVFKRVMSTVLCLMSTITIRLSFHEKCLIWIIRRLDCRIIHNRANPWSPWNVFDMDSECESSGRQVRVLNLIHFKCNKIRCHIFARSNYKNMASPLMPASTRDLKFVTQKRNCNMVLPSSFFGTGPSIISFNIQYLMNRNSEILTFESHPFFISRKKW